MDNWIIYFIHVTDVQTAANHSQTLHKALYSVCERFAGVSMCKLLRITHKVKTKGLYVKFVRDAPHFRH